MQFTKKIIPFFAITSILFSCDIQEAPIQREASKLEELKIPTGFNFKLSEVTQVELKVKLLGGEPLSFGKFDLVLDAEGMFREGINSKSVEKIASITLDGDGKYSGELNVPLVYSKLYLVSETGGVDPILELRRSGNSFILNYEPVNEAKKSAYINSFNYRLAANPSTLGTWNDVGYPNYLGDNTFVSSGLLTRVRQILSPGVPIGGAFRGTPVDASYNTVIKLDLEPTQTATVDITFLFSLAANANSLGYYWYTSSSPPANVASITNKRLIFSNTNTTNSSSKSGMVAGETVGLIGPNADGSFPPNITIGFFLVQNSFSKGSGGSAGTVNYNRTTFYSESRYNISPGNDQRFVNLYDELTGHIVYGVEDGGLTSNSWATKDDDFDDVVFFASYTPNDAVFLDELPRTNPEVAPDQTDVIYNPGSTSFATLMFEDSWPKVGDGDYNDVVLDYRYSAIASSSETPGANKYISKINVKSRLVVSDAANRNGLGILIPGISPNSVASISLLDLSGNNTNTLPGASYQLEAGHTGDVVVILTNDINTLFDGPCFNSGSSDCVTGDPIEFSFTITFNPMTRQTNFNNISSFLILSQDRGREVHIAGNRPTVKFNSSLVGTENDDSNPGSSRYFQAKTTNVPWALDIPLKIPVVKNQSNILEAYPEFGGWANSSGVVNQSWYIEGSGRRNASKLINRL
jgi:LruC domain-containing protein